MSNRDSGFTLVELLLAVTLGVVVIGLAISMVFSSRDVFTLDRARTNANQNLRAGIDIILADVRQAGERIGPDLPAVQVVKGTTDTLTLRRNLLDTVLPVCKEVKGGSGANAVFVAKQGGGSSNPECKPKSDAGAQNALADWEAYRAAMGGSIRGFIYDPVTGDGEFFTIDKTDSSQMHVHRQAGKWQHTYDPSNKPRLYILEERTYSLDTATRTIQLVVNGGTAQNVVADITDLEIEAYLQPVTSPVLANGTGAFTGANNWQKLAYVSVLLTSQDRSRRQALDRTLSAQAIPRNVLSSPGAGK